MTVDEIVREVNVDGEEKDSNTEPCKTPTKRDWRNKKEPPKETGKKENGVERKLEEYGAVGIKWKKCFKERVVNYVKCSVRQGD